MNDYLREEQGDALIVLRQYVAATQGELDPHRETLEAVWPWLGVDYREGSPGERAAMAMATHACYLVFKLAQQAGTTPEAVLDHLYQATIGRPEADEA